MEQQADNSRTGLLWELLANPVDKDSAYISNLKQLINDFPQSGFLYKLSYNQWYFDEFYSRFIVKPVMTLSSVLLWFDNNVIDGFVNLLPKVVLLVSKIAAWFDYYVIDGIIRLLVHIVESVSNFVRGFQNGRIQYYLFSMLAIILALFIYLEL